MNKTTKREKPFWARLAQNRRDLYLQLLWDDGFSEQAIADFLSTTKGTIVGRRRRLKVQNTGRGTAKKEVELERFFDLLDLHEMEEVEKENGGKVSCIAPVSAADGQRTSSKRMRPKVAASEATQCVHRGKDRLRCAYEWTDPETRKCDLHK